MARCCKARVLNRRPAASCWCSVIRAKPLNGSQDVVGGCDPPEGFRIGVVLIEEGVDRGLQFLDAAMHTAPDLLLGQQGEEALNLVQPGTAGRGQVDMPARALGQPVADQSGLVRGVVVPDQMHIQPSRYCGLDLVAELAELSGAMTRIALTDDLPRCDGKRGEQRGRAMPGVIMAAPLRLSGSHGKPRLAAIQRLDL